MLNLSCLLLKFNPWYFSTPTSFYNGQLHVHSLVRFLPLACPFNPPYMSKEWHLGRFRRVVVYFCGLQTHTDDTKVVTKRPKCHSLCMSIFGIQYMHIRGVGVD